MFSYRSVIFLVIVSSIHAYYDDYDGFSYNRYVSPKADHCQQQGTQCSEDCTAVFYCSGEGAAPIVTENCTITGQSCSSNITVTAVCSSSSSDCPAPGEQLAIQCNEAGNFPDPYNCRKSYTCESNNPDPTEQCTCPPASFWAGPTVDCNNDATSNAVEACCDDFEVNCTGTQIGNNFGACVLTGSGYYYICERASGTPSISLHKCSTAGQFWNATSFKCESTLLLDQYNEEEINFNQKSVKVLPICDSLTTLPTTTTTEQSSDTTTTTELSTDTPTTEITTTTELSTDTPTTEITTTTERLPTPPTNCTFVGEIIAIPGECRLYFVCDENLQPELRECEEGSHLDCSLNGCYCLFGPCP